MIIALVLGIVFGFISAIPVAGPVSAIIFSRGMEGKYSQGRWIAFGAGAVEAVYTFFAFWGFSHLLADLSFILELSHLVAALILGFLGVYFFRSKKMRQPGTPSNKTTSHSQRSFFIGAGMSAVNPTLIATWTAAITTLYSMHLFEFKTWNGVALSLGVCTGILGWFTLLLKIMAKHRNSIDAKVLDIGLKAIGLLLGGLSLWMMVRLVSQKMN